MMNLMDGETVAALVAGGLALFLLAPRVRNRLMLSRAKHRSLAGQSSMLRGILGVVTR